MCNERFGLGPFFRTEPLGLEYVAAALEARGHTASIVDLRFGGRVDRLLARHRPALVGVACMHSLEMDDALALAREVRRASPGVFLMRRRTLGRGVSRAAPTGGGERDRGRRRRERGPGPGRRDRPRTAARDGGRSPAQRRARALRGHARPPSPSASTRSHCRRGTRSIPGSAGTPACNYRPTWLVETARGCPYRCSFCSVWPLYRRSYRLRSIDAVCRDLAAVGPHVFVADDLFWHHGERSRELAAELGRRGIHKKWMLVQNAHRPGGRASGTARGVAPVLRPGSTSSSGWKRPPTASCPG